MLASFVSFWRRRFEAVPLFGLDIGLRSHARPPTLRKRSMVPRQPRTDNPVESLTQYDLEKPQGSCIKVFGFIELSALRCPPSSVLHSARTLRAADPPQTSQAGCGCDDPLYAGSGLLILRLKTGSRIRPRRRVYRPAGTGFSRSSALSASRSPGHSARTSAHSFAASAWSPRSTASTAKLRRVRWP